MLEYRLDIEERSTWLLTTQSPAAREMPFYMSEIGRFYAGKDYYTRRSDKSGYYLLFTHSGRGHLHIAGDDHDLPEGTAMLISCTPLHDYHSVADSWDNSWMHFDGAGAAAFCKLLGGEPVSLAEPYVFGRKFASLTALARQIDDVAAARISHGISSLLTDMAVSRRGTASTVGPGPHAGIEAALRYIEERYHAPITIDDIAARASLSKYHFVRLFRRQVGASPYNYLIHYRVNQSKRLLCTTDLPVSEVAAAVGFPGESNYIRQFRLLTGATPARFRRDNINYIEMGP